ncbi:hypothetical protein BP6252_00754 [Coleophoma cylindrospora]|uniref:Uncharacterized protein n=1 Tax=Coleophoma cylindrospora TaxID=1849047 RepID=A0A3D8SR03_9HELO|nr:hypothetical protein BP6252_00754 [Coleophoma cylindrospora]
MFLSAVSYSTLARQGSQASISSSASFDTSSHNHSLNHVQSSPALPSWLHVSWLPRADRSERIAAGATTTAALGVMARELVEMHVVQAPDVRGFIDCIPVADRASLGFLGWRRKAWTFPSPKCNETLMRDFAS